MHDESHKQAIRNAINILENDGLSAHAHVAQTFLPDLERGTVHADRAGEKLTAEILVEVACIDVDTYSRYICNTASLEHYYNPDTDQGLDLSGYRGYVDFIDDWAVWILTLTGLAPFVDADISFRPGINFGQPYPSAADRCQEHYATALAIWRGEQPSESGYAWADAMFHLGWACHFVADLCVSPHTVSDEFWGHSNYEDTIDAMQSAPAIHAQTVGPNLADYRLDDTTREIAVQAATETHPELHLYSENRWQDAARLAIPRAEKYSARLIEKFLHEVGVEAEPPPLRIWIRDDDGHPLPGATLFYRHVGGSWRHRVVDNQGFCRLALQGNEVVELRPAAPGRVYEGQFVGDAPCFPEFHGPASPVRYEQAPDPLYRPSMSFYLRTIFIRGVLAIPWTTITQVGPFDQPYISLATERVDVLVLGTQEGDEPDLAVGSEQSAHIKVSVFDLLDLTSGRLVRSVADFRRQVEFQAGQSDLDRLRRRVEEGDDIGIVRTREAHAALTRMQRTRVERRAGERAAYIGPELGLTTSLAARTPTIMVTAAGRYRVRVEVDPSSGIGSPPGPAPMAERRTTRDLEAFFRVLPGTEAGLLKLKVKVDSIDRDRVGYPVIRHVELLVKPPDDGGIDVLPMSPVSIEAL